MARRHMPDMKEGGVNVTPLIDIVMCLIIFFMLVAKIGVDTGSDRRISIPTSIQGMSIKDMGNTLTLNVQPGALEMPQVTALVAETLQEVKLVDQAASQKPLLNTLRFFRYGKDMKPGGERENADNPEFKIIIRGDREMGYRYLEPVLITCAEANVKNVNFNTEKMIVKESAQ